MRKLALILVPVAAVALAVPAYASTITGTPGNDTLTGTGSADRIKALAGDATVHARAGADVVRGGADDDTLYGQRGKDQVYGGAGADQLFGQRGNDTLTDARGSLVDTLNGGLGDDVIYANYKDQVYAGPGDDRIVVAYPDADMKIDCGDGFDRVTSNEPLIGVELVSCERRRIVSAG